MPLFDVQHGRKKEVVNAYNKGQARSFMKNAFEDEKIQVHKAHMRELDKPRRIINLVR